MKIARTFKYAVVALATAFTIALVFASNSMPVERRTCGHTKTLQDKVPMWMRMTWVSHCCASGRLVNDLKNVSIGQEIYRHAHGRFALTIDELNGELGAPLRISHPYQFQSDGTNWSVIVMRVDHLAGNYRLDQTGKIFFNETRVPTTTDPVLTRRSR